MVGELEVWEEGKMNYIKMKDDNGEYTIEVESLADLDVCVEVMERLLRAAGFGINGHLGIVNEQEC